MSILPQSFYDRDTRIVAQDLLGCFLVIDGKNPQNHKAWPKPGPVSAKSGLKRYFLITETEAYCGPGDKASHAHRGMTARNKAMFGPPGNAYIYFVYGMHWMLNIVTERDGYPAAVLLRGAIAVNKPVHENNYDFALLKKLNGPAVLTKILGIDKRYNGLPVFTKKHGFWIESRVEPIKSARIIRTPRIGIPYAEEYRDKKWRYNFAF